MHKCSARVKEKFLPLPKTLIGILRKERFGKDFRLGFNFYLKNAAHMHGSEWKLVNQIMDKGMVYLNKDKGRATAPRRNKTPSREKDGRF